MVGAMAAGQKPGAEMQLDCEEGKKTLCSGMGIEK